MLRPWFFTMWVSPQSWLCVFTRYVWLPLSWMVQMEQGRSSNVFCDQALEWLCSLWNSLLVTQDSSILHRGDCTRAWIPEGCYLWEPPCRITTRVDPVIPVKTNLHHPVASVTPGMVASHGRSAEIPSHPTSTPTADSRCVSNMWAFVVSCLAAFLCTATIMCWYRHVSDTEI